MIGAYTVGVTPQGSAVVTDITCLCTEITIQHGRDEPTGQPDASTATLEMLLTDTQLPSALEVGSTVQISTMLTGDVAPRIRFKGRISDISLAWEDRGEETPDSGTAQVMAVSFLADLGRRVVGDLPFPQELDGARVARVYQLATGTPLNPVTSDPGIVQVIPRDIDSTDALSVIGETAESASGMLWELRTGEIRYADSEHRRNAPSALTLDACDVEITPQWVRSVQGLTNSVSIGYGVPPEGGGDQSRFDAEDPVSIARFGEYAFTAATQLARLADAQSLAGLLLARNSSPVWVMESLPVNVLDLDRARTEALLGLDVHSLITLTGLPQIAPTAPTTAHLWVEGWTERLTYGDHQLDLTVSGYCRTAPAPRWVDVPLAYAWADMGALTWRDATCLGPPVESGRWADVPASLRWNQVPPTTTWANYGG